MLGGVAVVIWGVIATYNEPELQLMRAFNGMLGANLEGEYVKRFIELLLQAPYIYIGGVLMVVGLFTKSTPVDASKSDAPSQQYDLYRTCTACGKPVRESASFCPHCASPR
jgi:hypothetical protein